MLGNGHANMMKWTTTKIALLGTDTDQAIADKLGISRMAVQARRNYLKIKPYISHGRWRDEFEEIIKNHSASEAASITGLARSTIVTRRKQYGIKTPSATAISEEQRQIIISRAGSISDTELAGLAGCAISTVGNIRRSLCIPKFKQTKPKPPPEPKPKKPQPILRTKTGARRTNVTGIEGLSIGAYKTKHGNNIVRYIVCTKDESGTPRHKSFRIKHDEPQFAAFNRACDFIQSITIFTIKKSDRERAYVSYDHESLITWVYDE